MCGLLSFSIGCWRKKRISAQSQLNKNTSGNSHLPHISSSHLQAHLYFCPAHALHKHSILHCICSSWGISSVPSDYPLSLPNAIWPLLRASLRGQPEGQPPTHFPQGQGKSARSHYQDITTSMELPVCSWLTKLAEILTIWIHCEDFSHHNLRQVLVI